MEFLLFSYKRLYTMPFGIRACVFSLWKILKLENTQTILTSLYVSNPDQNIWKSTRIYVSTVYGHLPRIFREIKWNYSYTCASTTKTITSPVTVWLQKWSRTPSVVTEIVRLRKCYESLFALRHENYTMWKEKI